MLSNTSGTTSVLWIGLMVLMAGGVALASNIHVQSDKETGDHGVIAAPAAVHVEPPTIEPIRMHEVGLTRVELQKPPRHLPPISLDDHSNTLLERLLAAEALPPAPGPIAAQSPEIRIREADFETVSVRVPELRRPPLPELPAIQP